MQTHGIVGLNRLIGMFELHGTGIPISRIMVNSVHVKGECELIVVIPEQMSSFPLVLNGLSV